MFSGTDQVRVTAGTRLQNIPDGHMPSNDDQKWRMIKEPAPVGLAFSGMASHGNCVYVVGGRENLYNGEGPGLERTWKHSVATMEYCSTRSAGFCLQIIALFVVFT